MEHKKIKFTSFWFGSFKNKNFDLDDEERSGVPTKFEDEKLEVVETRQSDSIA